MAGLKSGSQSGHWFGPCIGRPASRPGSSGGSSCISISDSLMLGLVTLATDEVTMVEVAMPM